MQGAPLCLHNVVVVVVGVVEVVVTDTLVVVVGALVVVVVPPGLVAYRQGAFIAPESILADTVPPNVKSILAMVPPHRWQ